ncbi:hypothetical protein [Bacillus wiedmannii]|uniref:hypothetical protein n=1 Tax=Bacillus wiedmannii TaxID=1890302 RepID=UPI0015CF0D8A|nr:hypothetical protein [Bacillus wiedmannii]
MDLEGISTNGKDEVIEGKRLPTNRFPKSAGYIKDEIANGKKWHLYNGSELVSKNRN